MCACSYVFMNLGIYSMRAFFHVFMPRTYVDALLILTHTNAHTRAFKDARAHVYTHAHIHTAYGLRCMRHSIEHEVCETCLHV